MVGSPQSNQRNTRAKIIRLIQPILDILLILATFPTPSPIIPAIFSTVNGSSLLYHPPATYDTAAP
ncbi:hypothetical protein M422DRAFT_29321 [Sphaerobolus stellatus SS14]|uniref:Unplaced genomic scaffold SPHSTscaffold_373, whole genome shotgun sequence n=1 Tax=Sphaerobolus stellatus (strain SS14) TaxID=990650 RepID=A0A0C9U776_SPHS4|nr:hypothetical protein M422DRAFT_38969 [Sphaerobolus stellatus SS14]KIJ46495.1 hypothetical protein M422DRAFT_29321 [Sphaerobolus stellatus SS14]